ncbi:shikimate dehydrogenase [Rhizobium sp. SSA_523]|uniref:shikimate dehydrogenase family protein n=1 Tax=Rhizobium sp. SSA_523 TaxID=2952477 RepID=UPI002090BE12|nr:shikimate dehydrogenase [Rhizobium sp. SSA_523]MCO5733315.1 shikimate dehydrogenase [Rhizobium sp. SSA_523]WKC21703.1 shikimate dehydrogenase [Rhizobium sp. SSA_523]
MEITGTSKIMFVLADPVDHVRASAVLNAYFAGIGEDIATSPLAVRPEDLATIVEAIRRMGNVVGFGVTIPHKVAILPLLDALTDEARMIGAVNFVRRNRDGRLLGDNLDAPGFLAGLSAHGLSPKGMRVLQLGAGGAGRATALAIAQAGAAELLISNRNATRGQVLADSVQAQFPTVRVSAGPAPAGAFDLIVNTTPLGMKPGDALPVDLSGFTGSPVVYDIIVNPAVTRLMADAEARGSVTIGGKAMLDAQMALVARLIRQ